MNELISIIIPTYNQCEFLERCLKSISEQTYKNFEIIVIDNSSTDNTIKILKEICNEDKKIKVIINSKNYGHIKSPFYGILQTTGDACIL